jgi:hypothetical protein
VHYPLLRCLGYADTGPVVAGRGGSRAEDVGIILRLGTLDLSVVGEESVMVHVLHSRVVGPLEPFAQGFAAELARQGIRCSRRRSSLGWLRI